MPVKYTTIGFTPHAYREWTAMRNAMAGVLARNVTYSDAADICALVVKAHPELIADAWQAVLNQRIADMDWSDGPVPTPR